MKQKKHRPFLIIAVLVSAGTCCLPRLFAAESDFYRLQYLLRLADKSPEQAGPRDRIYFKDGFAYCTGQSDLAAANNRAAEIMAAGDFREAAATLEKALKNSALFFPFRYNLGHCYLHLNDFRRALLHFQKAQAVVPEYSMTYLLIGDIFKLMNRDNEAIDNYRQALKRNKKELGAYILLGDLYFHRNQIQVAKKYYKACLDVDHRFPNGVLGMAKINYRQGEYYRALLLLKSINTKAEYDKAMHYYYAECAFKLRDYATASLHYELLLKNKNDKFFLTNPARLIEHKLELSRKFIEK